MLCCRAYYYSLSFFVLMLIFTMGGLMLAWMPLVIMVEWNIVDVGSMCITLPFMVDWVSMSFSGVVSLISSCVFLFSASYMQEEKNMTRFLYLVGLFVVSMNFLIFIPSLPALLLGWDGLGIVSYVLVIYYQNSKSLNAGVLTILMNRIGDVMILVSISIMAMQGHWLITSMWDTNLSGGVCIMVAIAAMTKSAQVPFSSWLPAAMAAPTPVSALVHSSTLVTAGVYLLIRFNSYMMTYCYYSKCLMFISVITVLMAGMSANLENDMKKVIALSTLSQLGVMMLGLSLGAQWLTLFHLYTHALFKALLFLCVGSIIHMSGHCQDLRLSGMYLYRMPFTVVCMNVANLSLCGVPFLGGYLSKDLILEYSYSSEVSMVMLIFIFLGVSLTAAYSLRLSCSILWGMSKSSPSNVIQEDHNMMVASGFLTVVTVGGGAAMQSCFLKMSNVFIIPYMLKVSPMAGVVLGAAGAYFLMSSGLQIQSNWVLHFLSSMWFLAPLSTQPVVKAAMNGSNTFCQQINDGLLEYLLGHGISKTAHLLSSMYQRIIMTTVDVIISYMVIMFFISLLY